MPGRAGPGSYSTMNPPTNGSNPDVRSMSFHVVESGVP
jgi:hypothetical protein